jgi:hypothetical protein
MDVLVEKGKALGLILAGHIPAVRFIVIAENPEYYHAAMVAKVNDTEGQLRGEDPFDYDEPFAAIVPLAEFKKDNPDGWEKFKAAYAEIAAKMEADAAAPPVP